MARRPPLLLNPNLFASLGASYDNNDARHRQATDPKRPHTLCLIYLEQSMRRHETALRKNGTSQPAADKSRKVKSI